MECSEKFTRLEDREGKAQRRERLAEVEIVKETEGGTEGFRMTGSEGCLVLSAGRDCSEMSGRLVASGEESWNLQFWKTNPLQTYMLCSETVHHRRKSEPEGPNYLVAKSL